MIFIIIIHNNRTFFTAPLKSYFNLYFLFLLAPSDCNNPVSTKFFNISLVLEVSRPNKDLAIVVVIYLCSCK